MASNTILQSDVLPKGIRFGRFSLIAASVHRLEKYKLQSIEQNGKLLFQCHRNSSPHTIMNAVILTINPSNSTLDKFMEKDPCTQDILIDPTEPDETIGFTTQRGKLLTQIVGYSFIFHLAKPVTSHSNLYIKKRLNAIGHAINDPSLKRLDDNEVTALINIQTFGSMKNNLANAGAVKELLKDAIRIDSECEALIQATLSSFRKDFENHGMIATNHMIHFCTVLSEAFFFLEVQIECENFKKAVDRFKAMHPDTWRFGRLLMLEGMRDLNNRLYPHLYTCALARAAGPQGTGLGNYKMSDFPLRLDASILKKAALSDIQIQNLKIGNHIS